MILGFKLTVAITSWGAIRDTGLAVRTDLNRRYYRTPPHQCLVGPSVMAFDPGYAGPGFTLASAWTEQGAMVSNGRSKRYGYDLYGLGLLTDEKALLGAYTGSQSGTCALHDAFRLSVTRDGPGFERIWLTFLSATGFDSGNL